MKSILLLSFLSTILVSVLAYPDEVQPRAVSCTMAASGGDDTPALVAAVTACPTTTIPLGTTLNISTRLDMSNIQNKAIILNGVIMFNPNMAYWTGNAFQVPFQNGIAFWQLGGTNINLSGSGTIDGQGTTWWSASTSNSSLQRPIILRTFNAKNVLIENIKMMNSPNWFNMVESSSNVTFNNITISAPTSSPNTDGWDTYRSDSVKIQNSVITNGDDCVSFKPNSTNILVSNLSCTGSHGISVGSLGEFSGVFDIVENVLATNVKMIDTGNGARIKAFAGPGVGSGLVKNVTFSDFTMTSVDNPIIIDQCYETSSSACDSNPSNVLIQNVFYNSIIGTVASGSQAATLGCSPDGRCSGINVNNLALTVTSGTAEYTCANTVLSGNSASLFGTCSTT